ncbi:MAG: fimbrial assembly protein FimA, partial [Chloroflexota bacterium]
EGRDVRQFAVVDAQGRAAAYSGERCVGWFGHRVGDGYAVAGNMLVGEATIAEMARAFESSRGEHLAERLVR